MTSFPGGEDALIQRLLQRDEAAYVWLYDRYNAPMLRFARTIVARDALAREAVQDAWVGIIEGLPRFRRESSLKTWVYRVVGNTARNIKRREKRMVPVTDLPEGEYGDHAWLEHKRERMFDQLPGMDNAISRVSDPYRQTVMQRACLQLVGALDRLPPKYREVVRMKHLEGRDNGEIARLNNLSRANQRVILYRGCRQLRDALGGSEADPG